LGAKSPVPVLLTIHCRKTVAIDCSRFCTMNYEYLVCYFWLYIFMVLDVGLVVWLVMWVYADDIVFLAASDSRTFCYFASLPPGRFATWTVRHLNGSPPRRFAIWTFRTLGCFDTRTFRYLPGLFTTCLKVCNLRHCKNLFVLWCRTSREVAKRPGIEMSKGAKCSGSECRVSSLSDCKYRLNLLIQTRIE